MKTKFEQIVDVNKIGMNSSDCDMPTLVKCAQQERLNKSIYDRVTRVMILINFQRDLFRKDLFDIPGIKEDVRNTTRFIYRNLGKISRIISSLDIYIPQQICHSCWWINENGENPKPYTTIKSSDIENGVWIPQMGTVQENYYYLKSYEKEMDKSLRIIPYYAIAGTEGCALEGQLAKMIYFHSVARNSINHTITNGLDLYAQIYGNINIEYKNRTLLNSQLIMAVERYDEIYIAGETLSYGLINNVKRIAEYYRNNISITKKMTILTDCTSPIADQIPYAISELEKLKCMYGIGLASSKEICL